MRILLAFARRETRALVVETRDHEVTRRASPASRLSCKRGEKPLDDSANPNAAGSSGVSTAPPGSSGADPLDEPVQDSRPDLVLADQVFDAVFKVRVVVDLDDDNFPIGFLDVDAVETGADRARGL
jgi:hypothetical protein